MFTSGLNALLGINPILYRYNALSGLEIGNIYAGFSAQNVMTNIPEAVGKNLQGFYSLSTTPILATVVTAIKELSNSIDQLRILAGLTVNHTFIPITNELRIINSAFAK